MAGVAFISILVMPPCFAVDTQPLQVSVKLGYFSLGMVKANFPLAASSDLLKAQAEAQLREEFDSSNKLIQQLKSEKKPEAEIQKAVQIAQAKISAKQEALAQLVQAQANQVTLRIAQACTQVARDKGLDIIVDGQSIFAGGQKFLDSGIDVTKEVISKLNNSQI
jgi:Skp family chaperone for outer membrane proteins